MIGVVGRIRGEPGLQEDPSSEDWGPGPEERHLCGACTFPSRCWAHSGLGYLLSAYRTYMSRSLLPTPACVICPASQPSCVLTQVCKHTQDHVHTCVQIPLPAHSTPLPQD